MVVRVNIKVVENVIGPENSDGNAKDLLRDIGLFCDVTKFRLFIPVRTE